tara:strand:+ start:166 stop:1050 length:885 start_codon:yes stop_codon:yes gene_type:complete
MSIILALALLSTALLVLAFVFIRKSFSRAASERVAERLLMGQVKKSTSLRSTRSFQRVLKRANIELSLWSGIVSSSLIATLLILAYILWGGLAVLSTLIGLAIVGYLLLDWRHQWLVEKMVYQMPSLLDHMVRSLKSGRTLGDAMFLAIDRSQPPLKDMLTETRRSIELGVPLAEAVEEFAEVYNRQEFHILAMGMRVNQRHGGNASELLENLIVMIRDSEKARRQLRALTGETRISAFVLALLPLALAAFIFVSNPEFLLGLWYESGGQRLLSMAFGLQVLGCFFLWRMLKSV